MTDPVAAPAPPPVPPLPAPTPPAAQHLTLKVDLLAILGLAAGYRNDKAAGMAGAELVAKYVEPVFAAIGYPLPAKIAADVDLLRDILVDIEAKLPARQLAVKHVGRVFEALGYPLPTEIVAALTLASEFIR